MFEGSLQKRAKKKWPQKTSVENWHAKYPAIKHKSAGELVNTATAGIEKTWSLDGSTAKLAWA